MPEDWCRKRMRISIAHPHDTTTLTLLENMLPLLRGVYTVRANINSGRVLVLYDDRLIEAWQLTQIAGDLERGARHVTPLQTRHQRFAKPWLAAPAVLLGGIAIRRTALGRSPATDSVVLFQLATLMSVASGYPSVRAAVRRFSMRIGISEDRLLGGAALLLATLRESPLVLIALFVLQYSNFRKTDNTLAALTQAGTSLAQLSAENVEPTFVQQYAHTAQHVGWLAATAVAIVRRDPLLASAMLIAANPRPAVMSARYALNYGETLTHERCEYIPMHSGMDLYELAEADDIVYLYAPGHGSPAVPEDLARDLAGVLTPGVITGQRTVRCEPFDQWHGALPPDGRPRRADVALRQVIVVPPELWVAASHQRQGASLFVRGSLATLANNLKLSHALRRHVRGSTQVSGTFAAASLVAGAAGLPVKTLNLIADAFVLSLLVLCNRLYPQDQTAHVRPFTRAPLP
ncbi:MAG: hypothetical protein OWU32_07745 [Firmicutes bacterium]|nr:hypothetical protein [Bacillota bacterium]